MNLVEYLERQPRVLTLAQGLALAALARILVPHWNAGIGLAFFLLAIASLSVLKRSVEQQKRWVRTDDLIGTVDKRHFLDLADSEMNRSRRYGRPFTVAYLDIDNLRSINDRLGRRTGDAVLRAVAETIRGKIRSPDAAARMGEDEFAILFPETPAGAAQLTVRRIHKSLLAVAQKNEWPVSFSIATATFVHSPPSTEKLLKTMEAILASAKQCGKNSSRHEVCDSTTAY